MTATIGRPTAAEARLPDESAILPLAAHENFSVASLLLGRETRNHLLAIYGFARLVDQLGDEVPGDRLAQLDLLEREVGRVFDGEPEPPLLQRLAHTARACNFPREPFLRLIAANRRDQTTSRYATYKELLAYCDLSANPVGELVLHVFGAATPDRIALSNKVCSALQLIEHWQDVREDLARGRVYVPAEDLERFAVSADELRSEVPTPQFRRLLAFEVDRARRLLDDGAPLIRRLRGRARIAVAGYVAGGRAALDAIAGADFDVLGGTPRAGRPQRLRETLRAYAVGR
jgi:squalene synthase HpnC